MDWSKNTGKFTVLTEQKSGVSMSMITKAPHHVAASRQTKANDPGTLILQNVLSFAVLGTHERSIDASAKV